MTRKRSVARAGVSIPMTDDNSRHTTMHECIVCLSVPHRCWRWLEDTSFLEAEVVASDARWM